MYCYIHIPFCESKCKYCRFASVGSLDKFLVKKYVEKLSEEIKNYSNKTQKLQTIYLGGGTPSILDQESLLKILTQLKNKFGFEKNIEITLETTPQNITKKNILLWENLKINRISVGVQTLNEKSLKAINRDNKAKIINGLKLFKKSKIQNISIDLILGLPFVQKGEILKNLKYLYKKFRFIKHFSVYMLEDFYEVEEIETGNNFDKIIYPTNWKDLGISQEQIGEDYIKISNFLCKKKFNKYELSNFAKKGFNSKHNTGYWLHKDIIGFGLGAHSFLENKRFANKSDFKGYYQNELEYTDYLNDDDLFIEKIMFGLRTCGIEKKFTKNLNQEKVEFFIKNGFLKWQNNFLVLTQKSFSLSDFILKEII